MSKTIALSLRKPTPEVLVKEAFAADHKRLYDFIRRRVPTGTDAEDILQDVFTSLSENMPGIHHIQSVSSWLFRVARNRITDWFRKKKTLSLEDLYTYETDDDGETRQADHLLVATSGHTLDYLQRKTLYKAIMLALDKLPEAQRNVFIAQELEGKSFKQIADETGEKIPTLISRKRYAVVAMRKELQPLYNELYTG
jgi:RNA polymerase sigma factor (sigma-70 family)